MTSLFLKPQMGTSQNHEHYSTIHQDMEAQQQSKRSNASPQIKNIQNNTLFQHQEHSKKPKFLIKINRNMQNAFPSNFFSNPTTKKGLHPNTFYSASKNHHKPLYQSINHQSKESQQLKIKSNLRYQSINVQPISETLILKQQQKPRQNFCRFKSSKSLQTSIERRQIKIQNSFSFEKDKDDCNILPKTAATAQNLDDDDLLNITFGNGWKKNSQTNQNQHQSSVILTNNNPKQGKIFRLRNVQSLELKKPSIKNMRKKQANLMTSQKFIEKSAQFQRSERKSVTHHFKKEKVFKMYNNSDTSQNQFIKLKLNVDEIVRKKIAVPPKMKNIVVDFSNKQKFNKMIKLVF